MFKLPIQYYKTGEEGGRSTPPPSKDDEEGVDESSYLHSQIESANQRIERLQDEMINVLNELNKIKRPNGQK